MASASSSGSTSVSRIRRISETSSRTDGAVTPFSTSAAATKGPPERRCSKRVLAP